MTIGRWQNVADWAEIAGIFLLLALLGAVALIIATALGIKILLNGLIYGPALWLAARRGART